MGKSQETSSKKDREKKKVLKRKDKEQKKQDRKANSKKGKTLEEMMAYVDEFGRITTTPPSLQNRSEVNVADIEIGVRRREDPDPSELIRTGRVTYFNDAKGYGFIRDLQTQESIFVHVNSLNFDIRENDRVTFEIEKSQRGPVAVRVSKVE